MRIGERRILDVVFGLLLASGLCVGYVCFWAFRNWISPLGEGAFAIYVFGAVSLIPTGLACIATGVRAFRGAPDRDVRLGAALLTGHLIAWGVVVGLLMGVKGAAPGWMIAVVALEPGVFAAGSIYLAGRWFWIRRRHAGDQLPA